MVAELGIDLRRIVEGAIIAAQRPCANLENLALTLFPRFDPRRRFFMVMSAYFDESGTHGAESPIVTVAGFAATVAQWAAYERELAALLAEFRIKTFHAKDLRLRKGDFKGWTRLRQATFNSQFLQLADSNLTIGMAMLVSTEAYDRIYRAGHFRRRARPDSIYGLCFRCALWKMLVFMQDRRDEWPLNIVMDDGHRNAGDAIRIFTETRDELRREYEGLLGAISFASKRDLLPLAIADSLAYAIFRKNAGYSQHPTNPNAAVVGPAEPPYLVHKIPLSQTLIDDDTLVMLRDQLT